jgi:hypothetical protein
MSFWSHAKRLVAARSDVRVQGVHQALDNPRTTHIARRAARSRSWGARFLFAAMAWVAAATMFSIASPAEAAVVCTVNKTIARGSAITIDFTGSNSGSACNITIAVSTNTAPSHGTLTREPVGTSGRNRRIIYTHTDTSNSANSDSFIMDGDNFGDTINVNITIQSADLRTSVSNSGAALQGQTGYVINGTVTNNGTSQTSGTVTATYSLPTGVTATAISGTGWTCTLATTSCTRSDTVAINNSYPTVDLTVSFASNATSPKVVTFTASGVEDVSSNNSSTTSITVNSPTPTVTAVSPTSGPATGGSSVIVTGTNFTGTTAVSFGGTAASSFTVDSATQITATSPAHAAGTVDVAVTNAAGTNTNTSADDFTYVAAPTVTAINPTEGPTAGGTSVVITGTNLSGATAVSFGGTAASGFTVNSATQITATAPAGTGTVDVRVTTVGGTSATSAADQYTYRAAPTVTALSPTSGSTAGGTSVVLTGTNFAGATAVTFGATAASGFTVNSATQITATSPAGSAGTVNVRVTTAGGTSATGAANQFTYTSIALSPSSPLTAATVGVSYSNSVSASGGTGPYTYAVTSGALPAGLTLASDGTLSGTPTAGGSFNFTITATDTSNASTGSQAYALTVNAPTITVSPNFPPNQNVGQATNLTFTASGGTATYTWAVTAGSLPAGISLDANTGVMSGTATEGGTFNFTLTATDSSTGTGPYSGSKGYTLVWQAAIVTTTGTLGDGEVGQAYSQTLAGSGGTAPYSFQITGGALPAGVSLNASTGEVSGTPTASGSFTVFIVAQDSSTGTGPYTGGNSYSFQIAAPTVAIDTLFVPNGQAGVAFSEQLSASGGTGPYSFTIQSGDLPAGLSLASDGTISGTPTEVCSCSVLFQVTDSTTGDGPYSATKNLAVTIFAPSIVLAPASLSDATIGQSYSVTITASGGTASYSYAVTAGALPAGLTLASDGSLSGTPTQAGTFNFTVTATDSTTGSGAPFSADKAYSLTVNAPTIVFDTLTVDDGAFGLSYSDTVSASGGTAPYSYAVTAGALPNGLSLASDGTLSGTPAEAGSFNFTITATDSSTGTGAPFTGSLAFSMSVAPPTITLSPVDTADGQIGVAYSDTVSASGGTAPYGYTVTGGALPAGLSLNSSTGEISGTPTEAGSFNVTITATDDLSFTGSQLYSFDITAPTIVLAPASLADGVNGTPYNASISASGGTSTYSYAVTAGALPPGLSLATDGTLSGTPTSDGTFNFTVTATDSSTGTGAPFTGSQAYSLTIAAVVITLSPTDIADGQIGVAYSDTVSASGGTAPYGYTVTGGALPAGLSLNSTTGEISGTPTEGGSFNVTITATDDQSFTGSQLYSFDITAPTIVLAPASLSNGQVAVAYNASISASGGTSTYSYAVTAGALPAGLSLASDGTLSGTPTASGPFNFTVTATDSSTGSGPYGGSRAYSLTIDPPTITFSPATLTAGTVGTAYSQSISASGGTAPYGSFQVASGALPAGLTLSSAGVVSGTPTQAGTFNFTVQATDSTTGAGPHTATSSTISLTIGAPTITVSPASLPNATVAAAYNQSISASGGTAPYSYAVTAGALPAGLTLASDGTLSGTPTAGGSFNFTVTATDSSTGTGSPFTGSRAYTLTVGAPTVTIDTSDTLAGGTVGAGYSQSISASGGTAPYSYAVTGGALPAGLSLASNGTLSGTPSAGGNFSFTITATDASTGTGPYTASKLFSLAIAAPTVTVSPATLGNGAVGQSYSGTITASGGTASYSFAVTAGALPAGLSLGSNGALSGTPTAGGSFNFTVTATDSSTGTGPYTGSRAYTLVIDAPSLALSPSDIADGQVAASYSDAVTASGGTGPYGYAITGGALPAGLSLNSGTGAITGTPTAGGSFNVTITATDSSTGTGPYSVSQLYSFDVAAPTITLAPSSLPDGDTVTFYNQAISASGGVGPYSYAVTAGSLPGGLTLSSGGVLSGTPAAGDFNFTVTATDSATGTGPYTGSRAYSLHIEQAIPDISPASLGNAQVAVAYSVTLSAVNGTAPYTYSISSGALPAGLTLTSGGVLSGTPTAGGTFNFQVTATDSSGAPGPYAGTRDYTLVVTPPALILAPETLPATTLGLTYSAQLSTTRGTAPYSYAVTAGALPNGLSLNASTGQITGTSTHAGVFAFTVTATDSSTGTGPYTVSRAYSVTVAAPTLAVTPATLPAADVGEAYSQALSTTGGTAPYGYAVTAGALPAGLTLAGDGTLSGTPTAGGTFAFTVTSTDSSATGPYAGSRSYSLMVRSPSITVSPNTLPAGQQAQAYSQTVSAAGGTGPYSFAVTSGALPAGLTLDGATGTISGTPTVNGSFGFTVTATDSSTGSGPYSGARAYQLTIARPPAPVAAAASAGVAYETATPIDLSASITGEVTSLNIAGQPSHGTVSVNGLVVTYTPAAGYYGADSFSYRAVGPGGLSSPATVSITVAVPAAPTTTNASASVAYNSAGTAIDLSGHVSGVFTSLNVGTNPVHGTVSIIGTTATYTPTAGYYGADSFTFTATGPGGTSAPATVSVTVSNPAAPTVTNASATVAYNSSGAAIDLSGNVSGVFTSLNVGTNPAHGTVSITGTTATYIPTAGYIGADSFTFTATGPGGTSAAATVSVTVSNPAAPTVTNASASVAYNSAGTAIDLTANVSGVFTSLNVGTNPTHGTVSITGTTATYIPTAGYYGADSFTFTATGPGGTSAPATVSLTVATPPAPTTTGASAAVAYNSAGAAIDLSTHVSGVFTGLAVGTNPAHGTVGITGTTATYTPTAGYYGADSFTFTATGPGGTSAPATVNVTVATPAAPTTTNASASVAYNSAGAAIDLSGNVSGVFTSLNVGANPAHGTVSITGTTATYTPASGYSGADSFTFTATGPGGTSSAATVSITVAAPPAPIPAPTGGTVQVETSATVDIPVVNNGGPATSIEITDQPDHGTVTIIGGGGAKGGETAAATQWTLRYDPTNGYSGPDSFAYRLIGPGGVSASVTVNVNVTALLVPVGQTFNVSVLQSAQTTINVTTGATNGPITSVAIASPPPQGTATVVGTSILYTAPANFSGATSFTYTLTSATGTSAPATINVTVNPRPAAVALTATTLQGLPVTVNVAAGASGGPFTGAAVTSVSPSGAGTTAIVQSGQAFNLTFTPAPTFTGTATVNFTLTNAFATSTPATLTITVQARPDPGADPDVRALIGSQDQAVRRFTEAQLSNFGRRLEQLHDMDDGEGGGSRNSMNLSLGFGDYGLRRDPDMEPLLRQRLEETPDFFAARGWQPKVDDAMVARAAAGDAGDGSGGDGSGGDGYGGGSRVGLWASGVIDLGQRHKTAGAEGVKFSTQGVSFGADMPVSDTLVIGAGGGYGYDSSKIGNDGTKASARSYVAAIYASWQPVEGFYVDLVGGAGSLKFDSRRRTPSNAFAMGERDGDELFGSIAVAWDVDNGGWKLSPYARLSVASATLDAFTETGDPVYSLAYGAMDVDMVAGNLGIRGEHAYEMDFGTFTPRFRAEYRHQFEGAGVATLRYTDLLTGPTYSVSGVPIDRDTLVVGLGADWRWKNGFTFSLDYEGDIADSEQDRHRLLIRMSTKF